MWILNEVFRRGLNKKEEFLAHSLDYYEDSFIAFQIVFEMKEEGIFNLGKRFEFSVNKLDNFFLEINGEVKIFFVEDVMTEKGKMADILDSKSAKLFKKGEEINLFVYMKNFREDKLSIKLFKRSLESDRVLVDSGNINIINRGKLGIEPAKNIELWQHPTTLARHYGVEAYSKEHFEILESYIHSLSKLGTKSVTLILSDAPWDGQMMFSEKENISNLCENNMVGIELNPLRADFSALEKYIELCFKYGIDEEIDIFGLLGVWKHKKLLLNSLERSLGDCEIKEYLDMVYGYLISKDYIDKCYICVDEPKDIEDLKAGIDYIRKNYPRFKIKCAFDNEDVFKEIAPLADKTSISFFLAARGYKGDSWYICCGPDTPNSFVSSDLIEIRALAYLSKKFGIKNLLRWSYMAFTKAPHRDARFLNFRAGDTYLVYPGKNGKPGLSLRYIQFLRLCEEISLLKEDREIYKKVFKIENMKEVLLKDYKVREDFLIRDYKFYEKLRRELCKNKSGIKSLQEM